MTTRPMGRQPPQRSLSSTAAIHQRPPPNRTQSQQFTSSSPTRRGNDGGLVDLALDGDVARPRIGTSRLRVEISTDSKQADGPDSSRPSSAATPTWRPSLPPRGRTQLHFNVPSVLISRAAQEGGHQDSTIKPMPLPVRPGQHVPPPARKERPLPTSTSKKDARPKPYTLEVPAIAPRYTPNGHADFYPWTGNHPEDQFSEPVIRQGYFDKAQMTQNETGSAKPAISPALKHKSGLQTLSALFTNVLAQRRAHGQINSASTFKPPPRVTVTDTKREMWLKDLANPTISLRRLSRSIPHGVRGKVLLDQSLSKNIPIERAVWLAKCVGANELRSFRRKGASGTFAMGGEAKWIRDFTVCVEQFLETIVGSCGEKDFKARITYAIRLATHFHAEHLLDREHYMDWLMSSLESSHQTKLPIWILVTQVYWKDLLKYRKYGRRLAAALMNHLTETFKSTDHDILAPLIDRLKSLLKGLISTNIDNFVSPKAWSQNREAMTSSFGSEDPQFLSILATIEKRNARLVSTGATKEPTSRTRLIRILDSSLSEPFANELPRTCWDLDADKDMLIRAVVDWSTSSYRPGNTKTFVGARIIRNWVRFGADVTGAILEYLDSLSNPSRTNKPALYHLVSELARSDHFSTPRYLQWLIARGGIYNPEDLAVDGPCSTRLLAELPMSNASDSISGLRSALLGRAKISTDDEEDLIRDCLVFMNEHLSGMQTGVDLDLESKDCAEASNLTGLPTNLSRTIKSELGHWLRQKVRLQMVQPTIPPLDDWDVSPMKGGSSAIIGSDFNTVRGYLEDLDDYSMLADVLKIVTSSNDADVLASCTDTLDLHLETFAAIGALHGLFNILMGRLRALTEEHDAVPRGFLVSMSNLASRIPQENVIAKQLAQELVKSDRKTAADACSPVSDLMAVVESPEVNFTDEIERILASGNSMDQATLERLFLRITQRLEDSWKKSPEQQRSCALLLTRLRTFDAKQFDVLTGAWISRILQMDSRPTLMEALGPLISFGSLALCDVVVSFAVGNEKQQTLGNFDRSSIPQELLHLLVAHCDLAEVMTLEETYRLRIKQANAQKDLRMDILSVIRQAFEASYSIKGSKSRQVDAKSPLEYTDMFNIYQYYILTDAVGFTQSLIMPLLKSSNPDLVDAVNSIVDKLLSATDAGKPITTELLLNIADDLSLPFCQVKLASMLQARDTSMEGDNTSQSEHLADFDRAIESAVEAGRTTWASIIPLLDVSISEHLRRRADTQFLDLFPNPKTNSGDPWKSSRVSRAENLLSIIDATARSISASSSSPDSSTTGFTSDIVLALNGTWLLLANTQSLETKDALISQWLPLLLTFMTIHVSTFEATKTGNESRAKAILALSAIYLLLLASPTPTPSITSLTAQTYDLALHLVDNLPEDIRQQCIRSLRDTTSNPRIAYLFSVAANPTEWLVLSQKDRMNSVTGPDGRPAEKEKFVGFPLKRWEMLGEPTPNVGENDTSLSLTLFGARRG
ncbi:related to SRB8-DNA-directed RNA polymerase II holoenzyme and Srb10 CDK subcomplex subunit [Rhynchosporium agropyri]|uniref:Mediator of RNA polymerase II transcription subunit 12 n=1 Tax=Rhynchosporium agropyri TaxID=914238 RepID=A0A1E1KJJ3_9HELO|nr:related to SRB8-DNA-directed RNA polymerase II holoenzyme and Srb10 CDK subcomplex subunit [Rhynchosporium agropyri]